LWPLHYVPFLPAPALVSSDPVPAHRSRMRFNPSTVSPSILRTLRSSRWNRWVPSFLVIFPPLCPFSGVMVLVVNMFTRLRSLDLFSTLQAVVSLSFPRPYVPSPPSPAPFDLRGDKRVAENFFMTSSDFPPPRPPSDRAPFSRLQFFPNLSVVPCMLPFSAALFSPSIQRSEYPFLFRVLRLTLA